MDAATTQFSSRRRTPPEDKYSDGIEQVAPAGSMMDGNLATEPDDEVALQSLSIEGPMDGNFDSQMPEQEGEHFSHGPMKRQMTAKEMNAEKAFESIGIHVKEGEEEDDDDINPIMRIEDELERDEKCKDRIMRVLLFVCLCDALGAFLMFPLSPRLYNPAPVNATQSQIDGGAGVFAQEAADFPLGGLPFALQFGQIANLLGQAIAQAASGPVGHIIGRKPLLYVFTFGGAIAFFLSGSSQHWGMYTYWGLRALTGLFGGSKPVVDSIIADMYKDAEPQVKMKKAMSPTLSILLAALLGPLCGMLLISTDQLFVPLHIGGALEVGAGVAVMFWVPNLARDHGSAAEDEEGGAGAAAESTGGEGAKEDDEKAKKEAHGGYLPWVLLFLAARFTDRTAGGQFMWLQSKGVQDFGSVALDMLPIIIVCLSFIGVIAMPLSMRLSGSLGLAGVGAMGQACAGSLFFVLATLGTFWAYAGVMMFLQAFTMMANMLVVPSITALVPASKKDEWLGYMGAFAQVSQAFCPLILLALLNKELANEPGSDGLYLRVNGAVCFASGLFYLVLVYRLPRRRPSKPAPTKEEMEALRHFEETGDTRLLTMEQLSNIQRQNLNEGKEMPIVRFGKFEDDKAKHELERIMSVAEKDFAYLRSRTPIQIAQWKQGGEARAQIQKRMQIIADSRGGWKWSEEGNAEIGRWFIEWLQHAGYLNPQTNPNMWKGLIMTAFPVIIPGGTDDAETRRRVLENPIPLWLKIDRLYGQYLKMYRTNQQDVDSICWIRTVQFQIGGSS